MNANECLNELLNLTFKTKCLLLLASKSVSIAMISLSTLLRILQIRSMLKSKDLTGLSYTNILSELLVTYVAALYGAAKEYPFSAYGEMIIGLALNISITVLYWHFSKQSILSSILRLLCLVPLTAAIWTFTPIYYFELANTLTVIPFIIGRTDQLHTSYIAKSTGSLNALTYFLKIGAAAARIFTNLVEIQDGFMLFTSTIGVALNAAVFSQILYYRKKIKLN